MIVYSIVHGGIEFYLEAKVTTYGLNKFDSENEEITNYIIHIKYTQGSGAEIAHALKLSEPKVKHDIQIKHLDVDFHAELSEFIKKRRNYRCLIRGVGDIEYRQR